MAETNVPKKEWHWRCRWFGHKYTTMAMTVYVMACLRCGFRRG